MQAIEQSQKFKVTQWNTVAMWVYNNLGDTCSICKNPLNEACINCQANPENYEPGQCKKVLGQCNHCFHNHYHLSFFRNLKLQHYCTKWLLQNVSKKNMG